MRGGIENNSCVERGDCEKIHVVGRRGWLFFVLIVEREISIRLSLNFKGLQQIFQILQFLQKSNEAKKKKTIFIDFDLLNQSFFNWDSLHARLNSHCKAWSYKKKKHKKIKAYRKSVQKEPIVKRCLLIQDLKPLRSQVKGKYSKRREFQSLAVRGKTLLTQTSL